MEHIFNKYDPDVSESIEGHCFEIWSQPGSIH